MGVFAAGGERILCSRGAAVFRSAVDLGGGDWPRGNEAAVGASKRCHSEHAVGMDWSHCRSCGFVSVVDWLVARVFYPCKMAGRPREGFGNRANGGCHRIFRII